MKQPELGQTVVKLRKKLFITQEELAQKCNLNIRSIQRIESGKVTPRLYTLKLLSKALNSDFQENPSGKYKDQTIISSIKNLSIQKPIISLILISLFFLGWLSPFFWGSKLYIWFGLIPTRTLNPLYFYSLITYSILHGPLHWLFNSIIILLLGFLIENNLNRIDVLKISLISIILGAILFSILNRGNVLLIGSGFLISGFLGASIAIAMGKIIKFKTLLFLILLMISLLTIFFYLESIDILITKVFILIVCFFITYRFYVSKVKVS